MEEGSKFCGDCGSPVEAEPAASTSAPVQPQYSPPSPGGYSSTQPQYAQAPPSYGAIPASPQYALPAQGQAQGRGTRTICIVLAALLAVQIAAVALFGWPGFLIDDKKDAVSRTTQSDSKEE